MQGKFIGIEEANNTFVLEKSFFLTSNANARLTATALGVYFCQINGKRIDKRKLAPGWTSYPHTLLTQTYDVSPFLTKGENVITFVVSGGWFNSGLGFSGVENRFRYGTKSAIFFELSTDTDEVVSDLSMQARESEIKSSGLYDGEIIDLLSPCQELTPIEVEWDKNTLVEQKHEPIVAQTRLPALRKFISPKGELIYDFGQNIAGVVEIKTPNDFRGRIVLGFTESLDHGCFWKECSRSAKATDVISCEGEHVITPEFTFHGFRYMRMEGADLPLENVTAIALSSALRRFGEIKTSNPLLQKLLDNIVYTQRNNNIDIPSDCPQRDERMGWTGDANVFLETMTLNYDMSEFMKKWLRDMRSDQAETGEISQVVPDCLGWKNTAAAWCDSIVMVPWQLYEDYGDICFLSDNFIAMKRYLVAFEKTMVDGIVVNSQQYGDWLALDQEPGSKDDVHGRTDPYYLATAYYLEMLRIVIEASRLLGDGDYQKEKEARRAYVLSKFQDKYFDKDGTLLTDTQTAMAIALAFHLAPGNKEAEVAAALHEDVMKHSYKAIAGIMGIKYLPFALADNGYWDDAVRLLLNEEYPGWLHEVKLGATTMWERWNSIGEDGNPNPSGMNSLDHYFFGSIMAFVYRRICGVNFVSPGRKEVTLMPRYASGIDQIHAIFHLQKGDLVSGYRKEEGNIIYTLDVPQGIKASLLLPGEESVELAAGHYEIKRGN